MHLSVVTLWENSSSGRDSRPITLPLPLNVVRLPLEFPAAVAPDIELLSEAWIRVDDRPELFNVGDCGTWMHALCAHKVCRDDGRRSRDPLFAVHEDPASSCTIEDVADRAPGVLEEPEEVLVLRVLDLDAPVLDDAGRCRVVLQVRAVADGEHVCDALLPQRGDVARRSQVAEVETRLDLIGLARVGDVVRDEKVERRLSLSATQPGRFPCPAIRMMLRGELEGHAMIVLSNVYVATFNIAAAAAAYKSKNK